MQSLVRKVWVQATLLYSKTSPVLPRTKMFVISEDNRLDRRVLSQGLGRGFDWMCLQTTSMPTAGSYCICLLQGLLLG